MVEILKHTPYWVFVLFFALLALGYSLTRTRSVRRRRMFAIALAMVALSLYGVLSAFGRDGAALTCWTAGVALAAWLATRLAVGAGIEYSPATQMFSVPGSWLPLALMMTIFFTKYGVAVAQARHLPLAQARLFSAGVSAW